MAEILKGAPVAAALTERLTARAEALKARGIFPSLAIVRLGENESDVAYERGAIKRCEKIGISVRRCALPSTAGRSELLSVIDKINRDENVHGCLMFRPLPKHIDEREICEALQLDKDVDCMTERSLCGVFTGSGRGYSPCTAEAVIALLDHYGINPAGKRAAVIGRSLVIGKPVSMLLQSRNATVAMCHTKTADMPAICREADILVVAAGHRGTVDARFVNPNQVVIDVGVNMGPDGKLCGDVNFDEVEPLVKAITPVPAGVGAVTTAVLCSHVISAAEMLAERS